MTNPHVAVTLEFFEAMGRGEILDETIHPEMVMSNAEGFLISQDYHGREGFHQWWRDMVEHLEEPRFFVGDIEEIKPDVLVARNRITGRAAIGGLDVDLRWWSVFGFRDGMLERIIGCNRRREALAAAETL